MAGTTGVHTAGGHWDEIHSDRDAGTLSWFQSEPARSLALLERLDLERSAPVIDVGGGVSSLVDQLLTRGMTDVTVLDVSREALEVTRRRLGASAGTAHLEVADIRTWRPTRQYVVWHDRAVFHFLTAADGRRAYVDRATAAVAPGGHLLVATFAPDGPDRCSGLPVVRYDATLLSEAFAPAFATVAVEEEVHRTPTGVDQPFTWLVARRVDDGAHDRVDDAAHDRS